MNPPVWVEEAVVIAIHRRQLAEHGGSPKGSLKGTPADNRSAYDGIRDRGLLESALYRPKNQYAYVKPSIFDLAAAYGYGIAKNHPFVDGNKRTSYVVMRTFLRLNGYDIQASAAEKYQVWIQLADSQIDESDLAKWIESKSVVVE